MQKITGQDIFSDRPQNQDTAIALIKLKSPALLATAKMIDGKRVVDTSVKAQVDEEHLQGISELKKISDEIKVIYEYKMVLNAIAVVTPIKYLDKIGSLGSVAYTEREGAFGRPKVLVSKTKAVRDNISERNSVNFLRADQVHQLKKKRASGEEVPLDGTGLQVGIIDTGIDYTHLMLGGVGTEAAFTAIDPSGEAVGFPNSKVVGGVDLAGSAFDSSSSDFQKHIPRPDANPIDEGEHGTHVAGTVAGIGDGVSTYSGVAPGAKLHAIKVFGADGSTSDTVVVAGLEYAADPNKDGDLSDQLDVVNLSLGSDYGSAHILYAEAVQNLSVGGTVVVAAAGNSGPMDYIVGAPSVVDHAISVAASVDHTDHNWKFSAVKFENAQGGTHLAEAIEGTITLPIEEAGDVHGALIEVGLAKEDLSPELAAKLKGNVALIDRGQVPFADKIRRVTQAGAIGVVMVNNQPGDAIKMGGEGAFPIPGVMISQALGAQLKEEMKAGAVQIHFQTSDLIEKPELIDTITDFSSKGPRSFDGAIKPEISAPGENIISAQMGGGNKGVQMSGTSMATPHIAGVMTLIKQAHPELTSAELKSLAMNQSRQIRDSKKNIYPVSYQGAGRVDTLSAVTAKVLAHPGALSVGEMNIATQKSLQLKVDFKNLTSEKKSFSLSLVHAAEELKLLSPTLIELGPNEAKTVSLRFQIDARKMQDAVKEIDGHLHLVEGQEILGSVPVLAVVKKNSAIKVESVKVSSTREDSFGAVVDLQLKNNAANGGEVQLFNLLGRDQRKTMDSKAEFKSRECDLEMAGYRIIEKMKDGQKKQFIQFGFKLFQPTTTWMSCEVSVLIDRDGDQEPDQELAGAVVESISGLDQLKYGNTFGSLLLNAKAAREIRRDFEKATGDKKEEASLSYIPALVALNPMAYYDHSTFAVIETETQSLVFNDHKEIMIKLATIHNESSPVEMDDYLGSGLKNWMKISLEAENQAFVDLPEKIELDAGEVKQMAVTRGYGRQSLMAIFPDNAYSFSNSSRDNQSQILRPRFTEGN